MRMTEARRTDASADTLAIFAGTSEGRQLVDALMADGRYRLKVFTATDYGRELLAGGGSGVDGGGPGGRLEVLAGRLDEQGMNAAIRSLSPAYVIDCTHPHALQVSAALRSACVALAAPYLRLLRPEAPASSAASAAAFDDLWAIAEWLQGREGNILLATGSKLLEPFCTAELQGRCFLRILPVPASLEHALALGFAPERIIAMRGPFSTDLNRALIKSCQIRYLVTKDSGASGGFAQKVQAAQAEGVQLLVVRRPEEQGLSLEKVLEALGVAAGPALGMDKAAVSPDTPIAEPPAGPGPQARRAAPLEGLAPSAATLPDVGQEKRWFPMFVDLDGALAVVVGGGSVALRRVRTLLGFSCRVRIVAPSLVAELAALAQGYPQRIEVLPCAYAGPDCLVGARLATAATDDRQANALVAKHCHDRGIPVSVADAPGESSYFFPAVVTTDKLVCGITSQGSDHAAVSSAAAQIRQLLAPPDVAHAAEGRQS